MNPPEAPADVERFRLLLGQQLGLHFDGQRLDHLAGVLRSRLQGRAGVDAPSYLERLSGGDRAELRALAAELTVGETYFFRYQDHFRAFVEVVLAERVNSWGERPRLRILSAGAASGEEAYTLAILLREHLPRGHDRDVRIFGVDVNPEMIARAVRGRYSAWSLRDTSVDLRNRYFRAEDSAFVLGDDVRSLVSFEERNLLDEHPALWQPQAYDVVFCRNVLMYLTPDAIRLVARRISRALRPGGYLFLGHAETLRGISEDFHLRNTHDTFYYQLRTGTGSDTRDAIPDADWPKAAPWRSASPGLGDGSWVDSIQRASQRVATLTDGPREDAPSLPPPVAGGGHSPVAAGPCYPPLLVEMLRDERFGEAMSIIASLPPGSGPDLDAELLRAILLTNGGQLTQAAEACHHLLGHDRVKAGAHYLLALCSEQSGDPIGASRHDQAALSLEPAFAMPRLHRGLLERRAGNLAAAQDELRKALALLGFENDARILLFGGGFSREALVELCRAELRLCGGEE